MTTVDHDKSPADTVRPAATANAAVADAVERLLPEMVRLQRVALRQVPYRPPDALMAALAIRTAMERPPDAVIGPADDPYLARWFIVHDRRPPAVSPDEADHEAVLRDDWRRSIGVASETGAEPGAPGAPGEPQAHEAGGNVYLHLFLRSDGDRAPHDHPWPFASYGLIGGYWDCDGHTGQRTWCAPGVWTPWRESQHLHHVELARADSPVMTLVVTGRRHRGWGFVVGDRPASADHPDPRQWIAAPSYLSATRNPE